MSSTQPRVALVTGSSRGLGAAIARRLGRDGLAVAVNGLHRDGPAVEVVDAVKNVGGIADFFPADVTSEREVTDLVAAVSQSLGDIDVLVVNATGPQPEADVTAAGWRDHLAQLDFFVKSPVLLGRAVIPGMQARRFGRIIQVDSEVADRPPPGRSAYATAKSAQIGLTRAWARELAPFGITVNTVAPGFVPVPTLADTSEPSTSRSRRWPTTLRAEWKQAAYPTAKSCSGLVAPPGPPISWGIRRSRSRRPSSVIAWP